MIASRGTSCSGNHLRKEHAAAPGVEMGTGQPEMKNVATDLGGKGLRRDAGLSYAPRMPSQPTGTARKEARAQRGRGARSAQFSVVMRPGFEAELTEPHPRRTRAWQPNRHIVLQRTILSPAGSTARRMGGGAPGKRIERAASTAARAAREKGAAPSLRYKRTTPHKARQRAQAMQCRASGGEGRTACGEQAESVEGYDGAQRATCAVVGSGRRRKHRRRLRPDGRLDGSRGMSVRFDVGRARAYRAVGSRLQSRAPVGSVSERARTMSRLGRTTGWAERA